MSDFQAGDKVCADLGLCETCVDPKPAQGNAGAFAAFAVVPASLCARAGGIDAVAAHNDAVDAGTVAGDYCDGCLPEHKWENAQCRSGCLKPCEIELLSTLSGDMPILVQQKENWVCRAVYNGLMHPSGEYHHLMSFCLPYQSFQLRLRPGWGSGGRYGWKGHATQSQGRTPPRFGSSSSPSASFCGREKAKK